MNINKKLLSIGFKKSPFYKKESSYLLNDIMILDEYESKTTYVDGKYIVKKIKKIYPKNEFFYSMKFTDDLTVWAHTKSDKIVRIYLEGNRIKYGVSTIENPSINSKMDIIKLLPKDVQRDLIINSLLK